MPDFRHHPVPQQHLHNIEPDLNRGILDRPQIIQRGLGKPPPLTRIDRRRRSRPTPGCPCLNLHERQAVAVPEHQVNLPPVGPEITRQKFQAEALKSGVLVEYVIHPGENHHLIGNAAQLERNHAMMHFIFEE